MNVGSMFAWGSLNGKSFNWLGSHGCSCFEVERSVLGHVNKPLRTMQPAYVCIHWSITDSLPTPFRITLTSFQNLCDVLSQPNAIQFASKAVPCRQAPYNPPVDPILETRVTIDRCKTHPTISVEVSSRQVARGLYDEQYVQARVYELLVFYLILLIFHSQYTSQAFTWWRGVANSGTPVPTSMLETM